MNESLEIIKNINWFLEPISDFILFFFIKPQGRTLLFIGFTVYAMHSVWYALQKRASIKQGAKTFGSGRLSGLERILIILTELLGIMGRIISRLPILLGVLVMLVFIVGISKSIDATATFFDNQEKISNLKAVVTQLDRSYKVADIEVTEQTYDLQTYAFSTKLKIQFYDYANLGSYSGQQEIEIKDDDIYIDALVLNFDYSQIETNGRSNITLPYRVYSGKVAAKDGIKIELYDDSGIPLIFRRNEADIYTVTPTEFNEGIAEISSYFTDGEKAKKAGVRSVYGNAVHKKLRKGEKVTIWVEQTGGLTLKSTSSF